MFRNPLKIKTVLAVASLLAMVFGLVPSFVGAKEDAKQAKVERGQIEGINLPPAKYKSLPVGTVIKYDKGEYIVKSTMASK